MSMKRGGLGPRIAYFMAISVAAVLAVTVGLLCFVTVREAQGPFAGTVFTALFGLLSLLLLLSAACIFAEMPAYYSVSQYLAGERGGPPVGAAGEKRHQSRRLLHTLLPRPVDTIKWWYFVYGAILGAIWGQAPHPARLKAINTLFAPNSATMWGASEIPTTAVLGFCLLVLLIQEYLLQQGKLIWDDIRDRRRDRISKINHSRALASGGMGLTEAFVQMALRWTLGLVLGWQLGPDYFVLFLLISLHQILYELWFKPRAGTHPVAALLWLALSVPLRIVGGLLLFVDISGFALTALMFAVFYLNAVGGLAALWRLEGEFTRREGSPPFRPQTGFFMADQRQWEFAGLSGSVLVALLMVCISTWKLESQSDAILAAVIQSAPAFPLLHWLALAGVAASLAMIMARGALYPLARSIHFIRSATGPLDPRFVAVMTPLLAFVGAVAAIRGIQASDHLWGGIFLVSISGSYLLTLHKTTYENATMYALSRTLRDVLSRVSRFLFEASDVPIEDTQDPPPATARPRPRRSPLKKSGPPRYRRRS